MSEAKPTCSHCGTELAADALVCDACGMSIAPLKAPALRPPPPPPDVPALTGPAMRTPPPGPELTAPSLRTPPSGPELTAPSLRTPPSGPELTAPSLRTPPPGPELTAPGLQPPPDPPALVAPALRAPPAPPAGDPLAPPPDVVGGNSPGAPSPADSPAAAHPSDETPAGYVTAESLWGVGTQRPSEADPDAPATESSPAGPAAGAAAVTQRSAQEQAGTPATRHSFPAVPRDPAPLDAPSSPPREVAPANRARIDGRTAAIVAVVVLLAAALTTAAVVLTGGSEPQRASTAVAGDATSEPVKTTGAPKTTELDAQVKQLDELMLLSKQGRAQAVNGNVKAAAASRAQLLEDIRALAADTDDKALEAGLASFGAAIRESLRQNRECGSKCSAADLRKVGRLKQAALKQLNPILKAHGAPRVQAL